MNDFLLFVTYLVSTVSVVFPIGENSVVFYAKKCARFNAKGKAHSTTRAK